MPTPNSIKQRRLNAGLTQKQLADAVGTSQQQIQRIEAGVQTVRLEIATALSMALRTPLIELFPNSERVLSSLRKRGVRKRAFEDEKLANEFSEAGIELDPQIWTLKYLLRNGINGSYEISGQEKRRLWSAMQSDRILDFVVFDSRGHRIALNLGHLVFWQFLFDPPNRIVRERNKSNDLVAYMACSAEPLEFGVDPDFEDLAKNHDAEDGAQLQYIFIDLEGGTEENDLMHFFDEDGEYVFLRTKDLAMISAPLWAVEPALFEAELDDPAEEEKIIDPEE